ncbi:MAG: hypothetical protein LBT32_01385 [Peptococcaceae bacterium]|jgi:hypothetical protein|nr:hypothetical protein [Peptococcaceae bacterium]
MGRLSEINKQPFWYAQYLGKEEIVEEGLDTGVWEVKYSAPIAVKANISPNRGDSSAQPFGDLLDYDRVIMMNESEINEQTILWIDTGSPAPDDDAVIAHNYIVRAVARSLNNVSIAIKRVVAG